MGLLLSILFSYVGAVELMIIVRDVVHQVGLHRDQMKVNLISSKSTSSSSSCLLHDLQENLRKSIKSAHERLCESDSVQLMADGIQYEEGYRIPHANEQDISKRWLEARASVTTEPAHSFSSTNFRNHYVEATSAMTNDKQNDVNGRDDSFTNNISGVETTKEIRSNDSHIYNNNSNTANHLIGSESGSTDDNGTSKEVPNIHFDEYSQDYLHALDGMKKSQWKNDESRRRQSYKAFTGGHSGDDILQRRRSEDIDGETNNPWGELKPESFHDHNLWKRERAMSIAENDEMMVFVDEKSYPKIFGRESEPLNSFSSAENGNPTFNDNKTETADESDDASKSVDVSNESQFVLNDSFRKNALPDDKTIEIKPNLPEILINGSEIVQAIEDGKTDEFLDNVRSFDDNETSAEKHPYESKQNTVGSSSFLNYPRYNCEANISDESELKDFSIVQCDEYESKDLANENKSSDFNSKRTINNRKLNMFAFSKPKQSDDDENKSQYIYRPAIRITPTEDDRIEQFLHENCEPVNNEKNQFIGEKLIKSKTTQMFDCSDENPSDIDSFESDSRANSPSVESVCRDSLLSDVGSDPIQFECKQSAEPNYFYKREDSSSSNKSNVLFERSQSRFSELEYIKGRDDWKDSYIRYDISEEIDSDNYHHLRRHSEAVDTLEYIRGREDWVRNEIHHSRRNSLTRIFEMGESTIVIQNEIDSDEYHHHFLQNEIFNELRKKLPKSFREKTQFGDFGEKSLGKSNSDKDDDSIEADVDAYDKSSKCSHDFDEVDSSIESVIVMEKDGNVTFNKINEITDVIENLITQETTPSEDSDITRLNSNTNLNMRKTVETSSPFIVISEAIDETEDTEIFTEPIQEQIQTTGRLFTDGDMTVNSVEASNIDSNVTLVEINNQNEIKKDATQQDDDISIIQKVEISPRNNRYTRAKSERLDSMSSEFLNPTEQRPRRTLSFENVEDLIRDVSNGPWLHI